MIISFQLTRLRKILLAEQLLIHQFSVLQSCEPSH